MAVATLASSGARGRPDQEAVEAVLAALGAQFGPRLLTSLAVRQQRAHTTTWLQNQPADAVVLPRTAEEVQAIVRLVEHSTACPSSRTAREPRLRVTSTLLLGASVSI